MQTSDRHPLCKAIEDINEQLRKEGVPIPSADLCTTWDDGSGGEWSNGTWECTLHTYGENKIGERDNEAYWHAYNGENYPRMEPHGQCLIKYIDNNPESPWATVLKSLLRGIFRDSPTKTVQDI